MRLVITAVVLFGLCSWMGVSPAAAQGDSSALEDLLTDMEGQVDTSATATGTAPAAEEVVAPETSLMTEPSVTETPVAEPAAESLAAEPEATEPTPEAEAAPVEAAAPAAEEAPAASLFEAGEPSAETEAMPVEEVAPVAEEAAPVEEAPAASIFDMTEPAAPAEAAPVEEVAPVAEEAAPVEETPAEAPMIAPIWEEPAAPAEPTITSEPTAIWADAPTANEPEAPAVEEPAAEEAAPVAEEEKPKKKMTAKEARAAAMQEEVKRQASQIEGERKLEAGYQALRDNNFPAAAKAFEEAVATLPDRPQNAPLLERARWGQAESNYRIALDTLRREGPLTQARENVETALRIVPEHRPAALLLQKIEKKEKEALIPLPVDSRPDVLEKQKTVEELYKEGRQYFDLGDYNRAEMLFEQILLQDEYNTDAMKYLRKLDEQRYKARTRERDSAVAGMMQDVRAAWNPPVRDEIQLPERVVDRGTIMDKTASQRLQEKMAKIIIPSLEFRQANIHDVVKYLVDASIVGDPEGVGVNIILNLGVPGEGGAASIPAPVAVAPATGAPAGDEFDSFFNEPAASPVAASPTPGVRTITLNLRRVSLIDAIKYITEVANLKFRVEESVVIITPAGVVSGRVLTRMYPVQPSILDVIVEKEEAAPARQGDFIEMGGGSKQMKRGDVKDFFERAGVPFPVGTSITYNPQISQLIVANTAENLDTFERILAQLNVIPSQVEIEARFVEVNQSDLEELGLQWMLTDNYEIAQQQGGTIAGSQRIQVNADQNGFTKGLRFFAMDKTTGAINPASAVSRSPNQTALGGILSVASVLTNPELTVVLQALSQRGHADLLSAPRITTRSGVNAQIQVVKEIIYPTEFEVTQPTVQSQGDLVTPPTVTPGAFQTREVGVILNVTPTVGPDGYTIDLTLVPEVAELVDWIQYGSEITLEIPRTDADGVQIGTNTRTYQFNMPQPIFSSRNVTTSIVIWDNQTVVMGGLIREELVTVEDKIPFLGDIPIIGRLFRTEGQHSRKTNLIIFVTARLVDPAGKPLHKAEARALPGGSVQASEATATP